MNKKNFTKYYVYLRKSSEGEDRQIQSIERQADEIHKLITGSGLFIAGTFQECRSAMTPNNRPEFLKMIKGIKAGKANGIICWHINRLSRNPLESGIVQQLLEDGKIQSIITKDREYCAADNAIIFSVESSLATQYSKDLGKMVKSGMEKKVSMGIAPTKAPIGYLNTKMAEHGSNFIIKDPERFETVRRIWDMMLTGAYTPSAILEIVNKGIGLKKPLGGKKGNMPLARSAIYKLLTNPFYTGLFLYNGQLYKGKHEAMITTDEFDKVQTLLGKKGKPRRKDIFFSFTGIMTCGDCGSAITASEKGKLIKSTGLQKKYIYYHCSGRKKGAENCTSRNVISVTELEAMIGSEINKISISKVFYDVAVKILKESYGAVLDQERTLYLNREKEIKKLEKEMQNLLQMRIAESISNDEYLYEKASRQKSIVIMKKKVEEHEQYGQNVINEIEDTLKEFINMQEHFVQASPEYKKRIFSSIGWNYVLLHKKLIISKPGWLNELINSKKEIEQEIAWLELEDYIEKSAYISYFSDVFPLMRALVDKVGTEILNTKPENHKKQRSFIREVTNE